MKAFDGEENENIFKVRDVLIYPRLASLSVLWVYIYGMSSFFSNTISLLDLFSNGRVVGNYEGT